MDDNDRLLVRPSLAVPGLLGLLVVVVELAKVGL